MIARFVLHFGSQKDVRRVDIAVKEGQTADEAAKEKAKDFGRMPVPPSNVEYVIVQN